MRSRTHAELLGFAIVAVAAAWMATGCGSGGDLAAPTPQESPEEGDIAAPAPQQSPEEGDVAVPAPQQNLEDEGFERILKQRRNGTFHKGGWNHYGPGYFELDARTGVLSSYGGMGLFWYSVQEYGDFILDLEFMTEVENANSGVFVRVPGVPSSDSYIYHSWEVQIQDTGEEIHRTGAVYDAEAPSQLASKGPGEWNHMRITFVGDHIAVEINGEKVIDWDAEPRGKVEDFAARGYIGLQNHDRDTRTMFRNIFVNSLD